MEAPETQQSSNRRTPTIIIKNKQTNKTATQYKAVKKLNRQVSISTGHDRVPNEQKLKMKVYRGH